MTCDHCHCSIAILNAQKQRLPYEARINIIVLFVDTLPCDTELKRSDTMILRIGYHWFVPVSTDYYYFIIVLIASHLISAYPYWFPVITVLQCTASYGHRIAPHGILSAREATQTGANPQRNYRKVQTNKSQRELTRCWWDPRHWVEVLPELGFRRSWWPPALKRMHLCTMACQFDDCVATLASHVSVASHNKRLITCIINSCLLHRPPSEAGLFEVGPLARAWLQQTEVYTRWQYDVMIGHTKEAEDTVFSAAVRIGFNSQDPIGAFELPKKYIKSIRTFVRFAMNIN